MTVSSDRDRIDNAADGSLLIERGDSVTGNYGAVRSLGRLDALDIGSSIMVDFPY
jgi:hypothetical protein